MNKQEIEKAIDDLDDLKNCESISSSHFKEVHGENLELAISALEKQIPKQVTIKHSKANLRYLNCPTCDTTVKFSDNYCKICGQALKGV